MSISKKPSTQTTQDNSIAPTTSRCEESVSCLRSSRCSSQDGAGSTAFLVRDPHPPSLPSRRAGCAWLLHVAQLLQEESMFQMSRGVHSLDPPLRTPVARRPSPARVAFSGPTHTHTQNPRNFATQREATGQPNPFACRKGETLKRNPSPGTCASRHAPPRTPRTI